MWPPSDSMTSNGRRARWWCAAKGAPWNARRCRPMSVRQSRPTCGSVPSRRAGGLPSGVRPVTGAQGVSELVRAARERARHGSFGAHSLRHTAGTEMLRAGASLPDFSVWRSPCGTVTAPVTGRAGLESLGEEASLGLATGFSGSGHESRSAC